MLYSYFGWNLLYLSQKCFPPNLNVFWYRIWILLDSSVKELPSKRKLSCFWNLLTLILNWNCMKSVTVRKSVQKFNFEGDWGELETKSYFQRQSSKKYMRQTLIFVWTSPILEILIHFFKQFFDGIKNFRVLREGWALGYKSTKFSWSFLIS